MIVNKFDVEIQVFRSDNKGKQKSNTFHAYLAANGIKTEITCTYALEKNGVLNTKIINFESYKSSIVIDECSRIYWCCTSGCCTFIVGNLVMQKTKKQYVVGLVLKQCTE